MLPKQANVLSCVHIILLLNVCLFYTTKTHFILLFCNFNESEVAGTKSHNMA